MDGSSLNSSTIDIEIKIKRHAQDIGRVILCPPWIRSTVQD
jgi:hypothetical protein